ncbi:hypothetical protein C8A03DRAFT_33787 [Achaetomium macrosporum]|uniref:Uncharacterized protein n=1 Tax=Achaetomium macrosporum TaxID=79813 RepID=A0AAN7CAB4_9PEZI|nr:hypothetical protein C8A03DRAFT_33787 [Achaetomium macrosporum]
MENENIHQTVRATDGMLRGLVQRLSRQIENMATAESHESITSVAEQLRASLTDLQRVHEQVETSLKRSLEYEKATKAAIVKQQKGDSLVADEIGDLTAVLRDSAMVKSASQGGEAAEKSTDRLEAKLDTLTTKLELEFTGMKGEFQQIGIKVDQTSKSTAVDRVDERLAAVQCTVSQIKDRAIAPALTAALSNMLEEIQCRLDELKDLRDKEHENDQAAFANERMAAMKRELQEMAKKQHQIESEKKALEMTITNLKAKINNANSSILSNTESTVRSDAAGRERKRKRNGDDGIAGQAEEIRAIMDKENEAEFNKWIEQLELLRTVLGRFIPHEEYEKMNGDIFFELFFKHLSTGTNLLRIQKFMDEYQDEELHCLECIMYRKDHKPAYLDWSGHKWSNTVHLRRLDNKYYEALYITPEDLSEED